MGLCDRLRDAFDNLFRSEIRNLFEQKRKHQQSGLIQIQLPADRAKRVSVD